MHSVQHFFPVCVWPKSHDPELRQTPNLWKHLSCWCVLSGGRINDMWYWVSPHRQLGQHSQEGRAVWFQETPWSNPCVLVPQATKRLTFLRGQRTSMDWQMSWEYFWHQRKFIHSFIDSFIPQSLSQEFGSRWTSCHLSEQPQNRLGEGRITFLWAKTAQGLAYHGAHSSAPFSKMHYMKVSKCSTAPLPSKHHCASVIQGILWWVSVLPSPPNANLPQSLE